MDLLILKALAMLIKLSESNLFWERFNDLMIEFEAMPKNIFDRVNLDKLQEAIFKIWRFLLFSKNIYSESNWSPQRLLKDTSSSSKFWFFFKSPKRRFKLTIDTYIDHLLIIKKFRVFEDFLNIDCDWELICWSNTQISCLEWHFYWSSNVRYPLNVEYRLKV